jgi:hypothetical protein
MFIIKEVPERGRPDTTITGCDWRPFCEIEEDIKPFTWMRGYGNS